MVKKSLLFLMMIFSLAFIFSVKYYPVFYLIINLLIITITISIITINMATFNIVKTSYYDVLLIPMIFNFFSYLFHLLKITDQLSNTFGLMLNQNIIKVNNTILVFALITALRHVDKKINIKKTYLCFLALYILFNTILLWNPFIQIMVRYSFIYDSVQVLTDMTALIIYFINWKRTDYIIIKMMTWAILLLTISNISTFFNNISIIKFGVLFNLYFYLFFYHGLFINNLKEPIVFLFKELNSRNEEIKVKVAILEEDKKHIELLNRKAVEIKNMYEELIDILPEAIILKKFDKIVFVNKETERMLKTKRENLLNKSVSDVIHDDSRD